MKWVRQQQFLKGIVLKRPLLDAADDNLSNPFFVTKQDFRKTGKLKVVPVLKLSKNFIEYEYAKDIRDYFEVDYSQFCGLIYKGDKFGEAFRRCLSAQKLR